MMVRVRDSDALVRSEIKALCEEILDQFSRLPEKDQERSLFKIKSKLLDRYLQVVKQVKTNRKLSDDEKLRQLITPLILFSNPLKRRDGTYPFVAESIQIHRELDLKNLKPDPLRYRIEMEERTFLDPSEQLIFCKRKFQENISRRQGLETEGRQLPPETLSRESLGYVSLKDIYKKWLPSLDQEKIKSIDLLDQILVAYTIKRAQNGDEKAIDKLFGLYEGAAEAYAVKLGEKLHLRYMLKELKRDSKALLHLLISGFRPERILYELISNTHEKLVDSIPKWVEKFFIYYLCEYVPKALEDFFLKVSQGVDRDLVEILALEVSTLLNLLTPIRNDTLWQKSPVTRHQFNKYSYRPYRMGPKNNLTIWLFGPRNKPSQGTLKQLLMNKYVPTAKKQRAIRKKPLVYDDGEEIFPSDRDDFNKYKVYKKPEEDIPFSHFWNPDEEKEEDQIKPSISKQKINKISALLKKAGVSKRDTKIYVFWKYGKKPQTVLAKKYRLSRRQVIRICQKAKGILTPQ